MEINMFFKIRDLSVGLVAPVNWAHVGLLSSMYAKMIENVLDLFEKFAA
jgi:hypothetical protein